jgi:hypothetical protein
VRLAPGRGAHDPTQSAADASYDDIRGRVGQTLMVMPVGDRGAIAIDGSETDARLGSFGEEGGQWFGGCRHWSNVASSAPLGPLPPGGGVRTASGFGDFGIDGRSDPFGVVGGQPSRS